MSLTPAWPALGGNVRITRGQNQLNGAEADVNMKTGIATLIVAQKSGRVHGLVVPNDESSKSLGTGPGCQSRIPVQAAGRQASRRLRDRNHEHGA